jgi:hypothetical protein
MHSDARSPLKFQGSLRMSAQTTCRNLVPLLLCIVTSACSGKSDPRRHVVPVSGRVLLLGKPVAGARVTFLATGFPRAASGETDDEGRFVLSTFVTGDGAPPGNHVVTVLRPMSPPALRQITDAEYASTMASQRRQPVAEKGLPMRYADPRTSDLRCQVDDGEANDVTLELLDR